MSTPVLFILGAGPNIGLSVAKSFAAKGYKIALGARSFEEGISDEDGYYRLRIDLSKPEEVQQVFKKVTEKLGVPSVVVYNGAARVPRDPEDPFSSFSLEDLKWEFAINQLSPLMAVQEAVKGFKQLPSSASKTFIFTGNALNAICYPPVATFGMSKCAAAHMIRAASIAYKPQGFKFFYADERQADGSPTIPVGGNAAAQMYTELAEAKEQGPWNYTFMEGKGYTEFK